MAAWMFSRIMSLFIWSSLFQCEYRKKPFRDYAARLWDPLGKTLLFWAFIILTSWLHFLHTGTLMSSEYRNEEGVGLDIMTTSALTMGCDPWASCCAACLGLWRWIEAKDQCVWKLQPHGQERVWSVKTLPHAHMTEAKIPFTPTCPNTSASPSYGSPVHKQLPPGLLDRWIKISQ